MSYQWNFQILEQYWPIFLRGLWFTIAFTVVTIALGLAIGLVAGMARLSRLRAINWPFLGYIELFRCTPLLVQLVWFYYALPVILGIQMSPVLAGGLVLSLYTGAFYAEIFRGGIATIEKGQWDAARAVGLKPWLVMRLVVLPQAMRRMIPPFINQSVIQLKNTSLVSVIAVPDLLYQSEQITAETYRPLEVYTIVAIIYFALLLPMTIGAQAVERRYADKQR
jgi:polar amino acid transport system permease protein